MKAQDKAEVALTHANHRAEIERDLAAFKIDVHDRIDKRLGIGLAGGFAAFVALWWNVCSRIDSEVKYQLDSPAISARIDRALEEPVGKLDARLAILDAREEIARLENRAIGEDEAAAYFELKAWRHSDPILQAAARAAMKHVDAYIVSLQSKILDETRERADRVASNGLVHSLRSAEDPWDRAVASSILASSKDQADRAVGEALLEAAARDPSITVRFFAMRDFEDRFHDRMNPEDLKGWDSKVFEAFLNREVPAQ